MPERRGLRAARDGGDRGEVSTVYGVGDNVVYGSTGVCRIEDIVERTMPGDSKGRNYFLLRPLYNSPCSIYAPVEGGKVFMRRVMSRREAEDLIDAIPTVAAETLDAGAVSEAVEHYKSVINSHDCLELVGLTMSMYQKKQDREQSKRRFGSVDERYMKRAEELLFGELACALGIGFDDVRGYIAERLSDAGERASGEG